MATKKVDVLQPVIFTEWQKCSRKKDRLESIIGNRITYILQVWFEAFDGKLHNWYFCGPEECDHDDYLSHINKDSISSIYVSCIREPEDNIANNMVIIDRFGREYVWESEIPTRWLFEDFENEIIDGKQKFDAQQEKENLTKATKKAKQQEKYRGLANIAKSKLTKEELKAIRRELSKK